jgi:hypothetical protein
MYLAERIYPAIKSFSFIKRDGSLKNGLEIVSKPMLYAEHKAIAPNLMQTVNNKALVVKKTCGMHVHISKQYLTPLQIGKILYFMNAEGNYKFICSVAERTKNRFCLRNFKQNIADIRRTRKLPRNKYYCLNMLNADTIEFRIFQSVSSPDLYLKNIQFCQAIVDFCAPAVTSIQAIDWKHFIEFVKVNREKYLQLYFFLLKKRSVRSSLKFPSDTKKSLTELKSKLL